MLSKDDAWSTLPLETRQHLYTLLPEPRPDQPPHDVNVNPMHSWLRPHIDNALRNWQNDLKAGRETKKWREEAMRAGRDRLEGRFDEYHSASRAERWPDEAEREEDGEGSDGEMKA